jgi:hypothetical protein
MTLWNGSEWVQDPPAPPSPPRRGRRFIGAAAEAGITVTLIFGLIAGTALAAPGNNKGGSGGKGGGSSYAGTLTATPDQLRAGDYFDVSGCGYDTALGNVWLTFTGGSWGSPLDAYGCFTVQGIPALSGDSLAPGTYEVHASQLVGRKWKVTGETYVTVVP